MRCVRKTASLCAAFAIPSRKMLGTGNGFGNSAHAMLHCGAKNVAPPQFVKITKVFIETQSRATGHSRPLGDIDGHDDFSTPPHQQNGVGARKISVSIRPSHHTKRDATNERDSLEVTLMATKTRKPAPSIPEPGPNDLATAKEACKFLRISSTKLWRMEKDGLIEVTRIGDHRRIAWSHLHDIAKNGTKPKAATA